jgi:hypothetical protein
VECVHTEATGEVALGIVDLEEGGTGEDDVELGIVIVEVLDGSYPPGIFVNLIEKEVGDTVSIEVFDQFGDGMVAEPDIVERGIEGFGAVGEGEANVLKHHGCLTYAFGSLDANEAFVPLDSAVEIADIVGLGLFQATVVGTK